MPGIKELTNLVATHVSYVRKGANKKEFFLMKSDDLPDFKKEFDIFINKADEKKLVYGVVYEPDAVDSQNEFAKADTIEAAAHKFLADCRNIDLQHNFLPGSGVVVESYVAPADFIIADSQVKKGSWVLVTKASDDVWEDIKKGLITGYSMAGKATRTEITKNAFDDPDTDVKGFFDAIKDFFGGKPRLSADEPVSKSGKPISAANLKKIKEAHEALSSLLALSENDEGDTDSMTKTELQEMLKSALDSAVKPLSDRLDSVEKQNTPGDVSADITPDVVKTMVEEALKPLEDRISAVEKAKGASKQLQDDPEKVKKSVFSGINI